MARQSSIGIRIIVGAVLALAVTTQAHAVEPIGAAKRIDVDPGGTAIYFFQNFLVTRTPSGGFVVTWDENTQVDTPSTPIIAEAQRFRVYNKSFAPVAAPQAANQAGRDDPKIMSVVPLGANSAYLVYSLRRETDSLDHPEVREAFGQVIAAATGKASGARRLLNSTGNWDTLVARVAGLSDGRAVTAWYETDAFNPTPGRFVSDAGVPAALNLDFACCNGAQLTGLYPLGNGFVGSYFRNSFFGGNNGLFGQVFKANGQPQGARKYITNNVLNPFIRTLSNGRIAVFSYEPAAGSKRKLVVQLYTQAWAKVGAAKTLIADIAPTKFLDFVPTPDGGAFMVRTVEKAGMSYDLTIRKFNANFAVDGADYTFASPGGLDIIRVAALTNNRAVVVYRNRDGNNRNRLFARLLSY